LLLPKLKRSAIFYYPFNIGAARDDKFIEMLSMAPFLTASIRRSVFICTSPAELYYMSFSYIPMFSLPCLESTDTEAVGDTLREFDDLQREVVSEESNQENAEDQEAVFCVYY